MAKEVKRVESFKAWTLVPFSNYRRDLREHGPDCTSIAYIVGAFTHKTDPNGDPRAPGILNKFRVTCADVCQTVVDPLDTYSSCVDSITNRVITSVAPRLRAHQTTIDISSAYYHGRPLPLVPKTSSSPATGRHLYTVVPAWLSLFGDYPTHAKDGTRNLLFIGGNMPGRRDGGRIWQARFDTFLRGYGLRQLVTDRRVWVYQSAAGILVVHDHVDDSRLTSTSVEVRSHFYRHWAAEFGEPLESKELSEDFTGLRHHVLDDGSVQVSCVGVIRALVPLVLAHVLPRAGMDDTPMSRDMPLQLRMAPESSHASDRVDEELLSAAQVLAGTIDFVAASSRPDVYFAYVVTARYVNAQRITKRVFSSLIRIARYLINTEDMALTLGPSGRKEDEPLCCYSDSSHGNAPEGRNYAGFVIMSKGGGALSWCTVAPRPSDDSPGAAELRMLVAAYKRILGLRTLLSDLDLGLEPVGPTPLYTDSKSVAAGQACERIDKNSRWMATRYAMIRWGIECGTVDLRLVTGDHNCADIFTKALVGETFVQHRRTVLGLL